MLKIHTIGGYNEVGKNMTLVECDEDVFMFDAGLYLPAIVSVDEKEKIPTEKGMRSIEAIPDDQYLDKNNLRDKVRAIFVSHAHLDHVGAIQYVAHRYRAPVLATPFTIELLKTLIADNNSVVKNRLIAVNPNGSYTIKGKRNVYKVEFVAVTHSTIQCAIVALHTPDGIVLYANDYKFDNTPVFGDLTNYKRLKEMSKMGVKALIADCLYAPDDRKTPSEKIAKSLLEDVLLKTDNSKSGIIVTTFSSHIARLKTITEFGTKLNREVVFLGRSLYKYVDAASKAGKAPFKNQIYMAKYRNQLEKTLRDINKRKNKYLVVCTGHQGEPGSILDRMARGVLKYDFSPNDHIIFSSKTIPAPVNELTRRQLEEKLKRKNVRIFDNIHVSGHGGREDLRDLIRLTQPEHFIPSHGDWTKLRAGMSLALEMGYKKDKNAHLMANGECLELK